VRFANLTQRAAVLAAINLNQFFKKGEHKYENQNERQGRGYQWEYSYRRLKPSNQHLFSKEGKDNHENQNERQGWRNKFAT
jgi:hypothetical protein